jgi:hypothetical protein
MTATIMGIKDISIMLVLKETPNDPRRTNVSSVVAYKLPFSSNLRRLCERSSKVLRKSKSQKLEAIPKRNLEEDRQGKKTPAKPFFPGFLHEDET